MHPKTQALTLAIVAVVAIGSSASAGYKWVAYRKTDCAGADIGGLVCDTTILAQLNPAVCNSDAVHGCSMRRPSTTVSTASGMSLFPMPL